MIGALTSAISPGQARRKEEKKKKKKGQIEVKRSLMETDARENHGPTFPGTAAAAQRENF